MALSSTRLLRNAVIAAGLVTTVAGAAHAFILAAKTNPQRNRAEINSQSSKYIVCLISALQACERTGATVEQECFLDEGVVDVTNESGAPAFNACVDKAFAKATKKTPWPAGVQAVMLPGIHQTLNSLNQSLYNLADKCSS